MARSLGILASLALSALFVMGCSQERVELHVTDASGSDVESYGWSFVHLEAGASYQVVVEQSFRAGGRATIPSWGLSFRVFASGYKDAHLGSGLEADDGILSVQLSPLAVVSGTVTHDGQSITGAHVQLLAKERALPGFVGSDYDTGIFYSHRDHSATSRADGSFSIPYDTVWGGYYVTAWAPGFSHGMAGPVPANANGVHLELARAVGDVRGTMINAPAEETQVELSRKLEFYDSGEEPMIGTVFRTQLEGGKFSFAAIPAGTWVLRVLGAVGDRCMAPDPDGYEQIDVPHVVRVPQEVPLSIDLAKDVECTIEGVCHGGEGMTDGWASLRLEGEAIAFEVAMVEFGPSGRFVLPVSQPGKYRIFLGACFGHRARIMSEALDVQSGRQTWEARVTDDWASAY